jgi:hypothetical protein
VQPRGRALDRLPLEAAEASEGNLWRRAERAIDTASKCAASMSTSVVVDDTSVLSPPMTPAMAIGVSPESVMSRSSGDRARSTSSRVVIRSPVRARRTTIDSPRRARSKACSGCPSPSIT